MARRQRFDYFEKFIKISEYAVAYARENLTFIEEQYEKCKDGAHFSSSIAIAQYKKMHAVEEASDNIAHEITAQLTKEFITPIEREDILLLSEELDSVVDAADDVIQCMYMYNVQTISSEIVAMARVALKSVQAVHSVCEYFSKFKKTGHLREYIVAVNTAEEEGDSIYIRSMHDLYALAGSADDLCVLQNAFAEAGVLTVLEKCCDACEEVADLILTVVMKNS